MSVLDSSNDVTKPYETCSRSSQTERIMFDTESSTTLVHHVDPLSTNGSTDFNAGIYFPLLLVNLSATINQH